LQRQQLLSAYGTKNILALSFDEALKNTPWEDFLEFLLQKGAAGFVCGEDFRFGHRGEGTAQKLADFCRKKGLPWAVVPAQTLDGIRISSTHIRSLIEAGDMETAARFLGHPHNLTGVVQHGKELGRTIGIPTANLTIPEGIIVPKFGVYATQVLLDGCSYSAVTNIGTRPTVGGDSITVESWLLDYSGDLYSKQLTVLFYQFLRPEQKFPSLEALQAEIRKDAEKVRKIFEKT
jgi:riboflavin kinase/FMN adenylyltransferase